MVLPDYCFMLAFQCLDQNRKNLFSQKSGEVSNFLCTYACKYFQFATALMYILLSVALNYQTSGLMMDLNDGKYMRNGGCGYVLKPAIMREQIAYFSANTRDVIPGVSPQILHIKVNCYLI